MQTKNELIEKYAERGITECNKILNDSNQKNNHDYWLGKRIVFNSILEILKSSKAAISECNKFLNDSAQKNNNNYSKR